MQGFSSIMPTNVQASLCEPHTLGLRLACPLGSLCSSQMAICVFFQFTTVLSQRACSMSTGDPRLGSHTRPRREPGPLAGLLCVFSVRMFFVPIWTTARFAVPPMLGSSMLCILVKAPVTCLMHGQLLHELLLSDLNRFPGIGYG